MELDLVWQDRWNLSFEIVNITWWFWPLFCCSLLVLVTSCYFAVKRVNLVSSTQSKTVFKALSLVSLNAACFVLLWLLVLNIHIVNQKENQLFLFTGGSDIAWLEQQLEQDSNEATRTFAYLDNAFSAKDAPRLEQLKNEVNSSHFTRLVAVKDVAQVFDVVQGAFQLQLFGDGLSKHQWSDVELKNVQAFHHHRSSVRDGVIEPQWRRQLPLGEKLTVIGVYRSQLAQDASLQQNIVDAILYDEFNQEVSKHRVTLGESFSLTTNTKFIGRFNYSLVIKSLKGITLSKETIPFEVTAKPLANVLAVQSAPSFETKRIKNWAGEQGAQVVVYTQISKQQFLNQQVNIQDGKLKNNANHWSRSLDSFDLALLDARALRTMPSQELERLNVAVRAGLGLLILADETLLDDSAIKPLSVESRQLLDSFLAPFSVSSLSDVEARQHSPLFVKWQQASAPMALLTLQAKLESSPAVTPLILSADNDWQAAYHQLGAGRVGLSLIVNSNHWVTQGEAQAFGQLWQYLIKSLARQSDSFHWLSQQQPLFSPLGQLSDLCFKYFGDSQYTVSSSKVNFSKTLDVNEHWCGKYLTESFGWQSLQLTIDNQGQETNHRKWLYLFSENQWSSEQQRLKFAQSANVKQSVERNRRGAEKELSSQESKRLMSKWLLWLLFITCLSLLWIERKRQQSLPNFANSMEE